jgi:SHS2 domain-containing protein
LIFHAFDLVDVSSSHLRAFGQGGHAAALRRYIKAVTYHNLAIVRTERGLEATVVFDV